MNCYFEQAPDLALSQDLIQKLVGLDQQKLQLADNSNYNLDQNRMSNLIEEYYSQDKNHFFDVYGNNLVDMASVITWYLPTDLENAIVDQYKDFFNLLGELPEMRIQSIYGNQFPVHVDIHRTVSVIHPLQNHSNTWTKFYEHDNEIHFWKQHYAAIKDPSWPECDNLWDCQFLPDAIKQEVFDDPYTSRFFDNRAPGIACTMVDPTQVKEVGQIEIFNFPCILNIVKCHSVSCPDVPSIQNPRLSLFFKWRKITFIQAVNVYQQYVQSKI